MTPSLELELAKLEASQGRTADAHAHAHAERVRELLADYSESAHYREASALIVQTSARD